MHPDELRTFVSTDYPRVLAAVTALCGDAAKAEDAVQEALAAAWLHRGPIREPRAWVTKVALNRVRSRWRRSSAESRAYERASAPVAESSAETLDDGLLALVMALPTGQRDVVVLHYLLDLSVEQAATALGVSAGTVKTQLHRARAALREVVEVDRA